MPPADNNPPEDIAKHPPGWTYAHGDGWHHATCPNAPQGRPLSFTTTRPPGFMLAPCCQKPTTAP